MIKTCNLPWKDKDGAAFRTNKGNAAIQFGVIVWDLQRAGDIFLSLEKRFFQHNNKGTFQSAPFL